jgi:hypothetical protein
MSSDVIIGHDGKLAAIAQSVRSIHTFGSQ